MSQLPDPTDPDYWQKVANLWAAHAARLAAALRAMREVERDEKSDGTVLGEVVYYADGPPLATEADAALAAYDEALGFDGQEVRNP
jgi:hypothetical protein